MLQAAFFNVGGGWDGIRLRRVPPVIADRISYEAQSGNGIYYHRLGAQAIGTGVTDPKRSVL